MRLRPTLLQLHRWLGLLAGSLILVSGLSGGVLVFGREIETWSDPAAFRASAGGQPISVDRAVARAAAESPSDPPRWIRLPAADGENYEVHLASERRLFVEASSGLVRDVTGPGARIVGFLRELHTELLADRPGEIVLGVSAGLLCFFAVSGAIVWWPGFAKLSRGFRLRASGRWHILLLDAHRALGAASMLLLLIAGLTGASLVFHEPFQRALNWATASPAPTPPPQSQPGPQGQVQLSELLRQARSLLPDARATWLYLPLTPDAPVMVRLRQPAELHPNGKSFVHFDRYSGELLRVDDGRAAPLGSRLFSALYPIHIGQYGGLSSRLLAAAVGLFAAFLFVSGLATWLDRRRRRERGRAPAQRAAG